MNCDDARRAISAAADGEPATPMQAAVDDHVRSCAACGAFVTHLDAIRRALRVEALDAPPDVAERVAAQLRGPSALRRLSGRRGRVSALGLARVAAVALVGLVVGGVLGRVAAGPDAAEAADLGRRAIAAQHRVESLTATVSVLERGMRSAVPERRFSGTLAYRAPDHVALRLRDETSYPPGWRGGDIDVVVAGSEWWTRGVRSCPRLPECTPAEPRLRVVAGSEPFADHAPSPLDLVVPVRSLALSAPAPQRERHVGGERALGVSVTAAQVQPLLETLHLAGNLRDVHPTDDVELWLAASTMTPLRVTVTAAEGEARRRWARARDHLDEPGDVVLAVELRDVRRNDDVPDDAFPPAPAGAGNRLDLGYRADAGSAFGPERLAGLPLRLAGRTETPGGVPTETTSWTDGRSYVVARRTASWPGGRLFGNLGPDVVRADLGAAGVAYVTPDGSRIGIHAPGLDVVVSGSVAPGDLRRAAQQLGIVGVAVPDDWAEAATVTFTEAAQRVSGLLRAGALPGFGAPAVRVDGAAVVLSYAGAGARGFRIVERVGELPPPTDPDVAAVRVRGRVGRYSPATGALEWAEGSLHLTVESASLSPAELVEVARRLRR